MKKELTRRSFLKLAGVGTLAVAMSGSLTGCDVIDNLKDMDSVSAAIGDVKFMMSASAWTNGVGGQENDVTYQPTCEIRNNSKKAVTYGGSGSGCEVIITGVLTDKNGKEYPMTYKGKNGSFPAGEKVEIKDFELEVSAKNLSSEGGKIVTTFAYKGKKAIFTKVVGGDITSKVE
jgi:hypothetical protein